MPVGKRPQSNSTLYTLLTFVGLFILCAAIAIIYYLKYEEQVGIAERAKQNLNEVVSQKELTNLGKIVGDKESGTYFGKMSKYLDSIAYLIIGGNVEDTSADVKVKKAQKQSKDMLELLSQENLITGVTATQLQGLIPAMKKLKNELDNRGSQIQAKQELLDQLNDQYADSLAIMKERENELKADKDKYKQQVEDVQSDYENLKTLLSQNSEQRLGTILKQLEDQKLSLKETEKDLLRVTAEKNRLESKMNLLSEQLAKIVPDPETDVAAFKPDGEIMLLDTATKTVHLNIGSDDHVYRGLTFAIYDKGTAIPKSGKGKAEIEVYDVEKNVSVARIIQSEFKNPIVLGDIVANLIWDSDQKNEFVVAGEFDLDRDGFIDGDAIDKIQALIANWGGSSSDSVSINTDYLVLGMAPRLLSRPTMEQMEIDPMAMEKYQKSLARLAKYNDAKDKANTLRIPIFNYERFLYFIGYKSQSIRPEAF